MPRGKAKPSNDETADVDEDDEESVPEWKRQSVERSLKAARARARERSDRFVAAAVELMGERGGIEFTVQDVVDRARMSIRTFYNFFASKDDLLAAVYQTIIGQEVAPRLRKAIERESDPVLRIRAYVEELYRLPSGPVSYALTAYHNRLAETRPADLDRALQPQIDLVIELIEQAMEAKRLRSTLTAEKVARLLHHSVLAVVHARVLGVDTEVAATAEELWLFCAQGIAVPDTQG